VLKDVLAWSVALGAVTASGCFHPVFHDLACGAHQECPSDLTCNLQSQTCEPVGDPSIAIDAREDSDAKVAPPPPDAGTCFGSGLVRICLLALPTQALTISAPTQIDTSDTTMCTAVASGGDGYCVVVAANITISARLRGAGPRPLVLLATGTITTMGQGLIDVGSHRTRAQGEPEDGAGVTSTVCTTGMNPTNSGGGAGGSFAGTGGNGAAGAANGNSTGGMPAGPAAITALRAGCPGQDGNGNGNGSNKGTGGHGGGAVFLLAGTSIVIGGGINAAGEGGAPGTDNTSGGGGGGAGGMIGLDAPSVTALSLLLANGGGGGGGSGQNVTGVAGADPTSVAAAAGGNGAENLLGGDGGDGSATAAAGPGGAGHAGVNNSGFRGGGGAGGGGAGVIKAPANASLGTSVSPAATP
jgi:hypothetical protein